MKEVLSDAFVAGTMQILQNTAMTNAVKEDTVKKIEEYDIFVSGTIGMLGDKNISVSIGFSKPAIYTIYTAMFAEDPTEITFSSIGDLVGEVTNMISGAARNILAQKGFSFKSSIPSVVIGMRQYVHQPAGTTTIMLPFRIDDGHALVEITIKG